MNHVRIFLIPDKMPINLDLNKQKCDYILENIRPTIFKYASNNKIKKAKMSINKNINFKNHQTCFSIPTIFI